MLQMKRARQDMQEMGVQCTDSPGTGAGPGPGDTASNSDAASSSDSDIEVVEVIRRSRGASSIPRGTVMYRPGHRPKTPPGYVLIKARNENDPSHDGTRMDTLRKKALTVAALWTSDKVGLARMEMPASIKKDLTCWNHKYYPNKYETEVKYNTGECGGCCRNRCGGCCTKVRGGFIMDLPFPPVPEQGKDPYRAYR